MLDHVSPEVENTESGAEAELGGEVGEYIVPEGEDREEVEAADLGRKTLQQVVIQLQVVEGLQSPES